MSHIHIQSTSSQHSLSYSPTEYKRLRKRRNLWLAFSIITLAALLYQGIFISSHMGSDLLIAMTLLPITGALFVISAIAGEAKHDFEKIAQPRAFIHDVFTTVAVLPAALHRDGYVVRVTDMNVGVLRLVIEADDPMLRPMEFLVTGTSFETVCGEYSIGEILGTLKVLGTVNEHAEADRELLSRLGSRITLPSGMPSAQARHLEAD